MSSPGSVRERLHQTATFLLSCEGWRAGWTKRLLCEASTLDDVNSDVHLCIGYVPSFIDSHIRSGYTFIMQNFLPGDRICLFGESGYATQCAHIYGSGELNTRRVGFSRGAYTARALAGMLYKVSSSGL